MERTTGTYHSQIGKDQGYPRNLLWSPRLIKILSTGCKHGGLVKKLKVVVSLTTRDNDYQAEQAAAAQEMANRLNLDLEVLYADNDAILQSQQLLNIIQSNSVPHPDGIMFEPVGGTAMPQVARACAAAGIAWVVLNREVDYISDLRRNYRVPIFSVSSDHEEIGRIQGKQIAAMLPNGGSVLLIQGPAENLAAKQRTTGMYETKPVEVHVKVMKGNWTEANACKLVSSWLKLSTSQQAGIDIIAAQNDAMAMGARKAFQEIADTAQRERWLASSSRPTRAKQSTCLRTRYILATCRPRRHLRTRDPFRQLRIW